MICTVATISHDQPRAYKPLSHQRCMGKNIELENIGVSVGYCYKICMYVIQSTPSISRSRAHGLLQELPSKHAIQAFAHDLFLVWSHSTPGQLCTRRSEKKGSLLWGNRWKCTADQSKRFLPRGCFPPEQVHFFETDTPFPVLQILLLSFMCKNIIFSSDLLFVHRLADITNHPMLQEPVASSSCFEVSSCTTTSASKPSLIMIGLEDSFESHPGCVDWRIAREKKDIVE